MPTSTFTPDMPKATQTLAITQQPINNNFLAIDDSIGRNHEPPSVNTAVKGKHKFVEFELQSGAPAPVTGTAPTDVIMYTRTTTSSAVPGGESEIRFIRNGGNSVQLTGIEPVNATPGYTFLPGKMLMQWGSVSVPAANVPVTITYPIPFSGVAYSIQVSQTRPNAGTGNQLFISTTTPNTATQLTLAQTGSNPHGAFWLAIGPA